MTPSRTLRGVAYSNARLRPTGNTIAPVLIGEGLRMRNLPRESLGMFVSEGFIVNTMLDV